MNIDELIRDSIDESTAGHVPSPDLGAIRRGGRLRATVRTGGAALATVGVVAAGAALVQSVGSTQQELPASIQGQGPARAYISRPAEFHVDGQTYRPKHTGHLNDGNSVVTTAGLIYLDRDGAPRLMDRDGAEQALGRATDPGDHADWNTPLVSDPSGRYAAWFSVEDSRVVLNRFDSRTRGVTDRTRLDRRLADPDGSVQFIADGVTYFSSWSTGTGSGRTLAWDPDRPAGAQVYPVTDPDTTVTAVGDRTVLVRGNGNVYGSDGRPLDEGWKVVRLDSTEIGEDTEKLQVLSSDGVWAVRNPQDELGLSTMNTRTGEIVPVDDGPGEIMSVRADDDGSLLTINSPTGDEGRFDDGLLRDCDPATGTCTSLGTLDGVWPDFPFDSDF